MSQHTKQLKNVISFDDRRVRNHLDNVVRESVEEALNAMLDAEADAMCKAQRYGRSPDRIDIRAVSYERQLHTKAGEVTLKVPKLRRQTFETAIIERYKRRESSIEESLIEMYLAGVSVRRVEGITEAQWGARVSPSTVSKLNQKIYKKLEAWRNEPIEGEFPYVFLDGVVLKRTWAGEVRNVSVLVAIGVEEDGYRRIPGVQEGRKDDKSGWSDFLAYLKNRGFKGVQLVVSDTCIGLYESIGHYFSGAARKRCMVQLHRNVANRVPSTKVKEVARMLKTIYAQESLETAQKKSHDGCQTQRKIDETLTYSRFPVSHWTRIRSNNPLERLMREIRRRTRAVGAFPDGQSALMLAAARFKHVASSKWGTRRYLAMDELYNQDDDALQAA